MSAKPAHVRVFVRGYFTADEGDFTIDASGIFKSDCSTAAWIQAMPQLVERATTVGSDFPATNVRPMTAEEVDLYENAQEN